MIPLIFSLTLFFLYEILLLFEHFLNIYLFYSEVQNFVFFQNNMKLKFPNLCMKILLALCLCLYNNIIKTTNEFSEGPLGAIGATQLNTSMQSNKTAISHSAMLLGQPKKSNFLNGKRNVERAWIMK